MAQTYQARFIQEGTTIDHTPASAVAAGNVVVVGSLVGVAKSPIAANVAGALTVAGVCDVVKVNGAITIGAALYWAAAGNPQGGVAGTGACTTSAGGNSFMGFAQAAAADVAEKVRVYLVPATALTVHANTTAAITDPGNAGAIPVTGSGYVPLVTGGAETRTLAAPASIGLQLLIYMKTDGGNCVVTCATFVNETGNNTITFDNTGEALLLIAVEEGANIRWRTVLTDGAALTTV